MCFEREAGNVIGGWVHHFIFSVMYSDSSFFLKVVIITDLGQIQKSA